VAEQQEQAAPDAVMTRIGQVIMLHHAGDREEARDRFLDLWGEIGEDGDPLHRCTLAHYMADTQDDPADELTWDLRALSAAEELTDGRVAEHHHSLAVRAFSPSLHLNLAADYVKLGRAEAARSHLGLAREAVGALGDDSYGDGIRVALDRLDLRLNGEGAGGETPGTPRQRP
jgi:Tetratricopeptide repeat